MVHIVDFSNLTTTKITAMHNLYANFIKILKVPYRLNQKNWKPFYKPFGRIWKRVETDFSQFTDPRMSTLTITIR